jgi:poly-gamma-glutamate capsule biosynthesis protein CapA/YwtB (metallophosphatase superfamily)
VSDVFERADFGFVNLETPVAPAHSQGSKPFMFDAPVALLDGLKASGIKIVSFANNHVMDQGWAGFAETREHLREEGLLFAGSGDTVEQQWQPVITEANGIKVGWLGMTRWLNGNRNPDKDDQPHVNFFPYPGESGGAPGADEAQVLAAVKAARAQCDFLVVSIHWGIEYAPAPRPEDVDMAHKMLEAGASVIVGHHPHVLQPVETYKTQDGSQHGDLLFAGKFSFEPVAHLCGRPDAGQGRRPARRDDRLFSARCARTTGRPGFAWNWATWAFCPCGARTIATISPPGGRRLRSFGRF